MRERHLVKTWCKALIRSSGQGWQSTPAEISLLSHERISANGRKYQLAEMGQDEARFVWEFNGTLTPSGQLILKSADWKHIQEAADGLLL